MFIALIRNGKEVFRTNLPEGELAPSALAVRALATPEEGLVLEKEIDPDLFVPGENVIAVEIRQASPSSSDLSFQLALVVSSAKKE